MKTSLALLTVLLAAFTSLTAAPRTWTNTEGKSVEAELLEVNGDEVRLRLTANRQVYILSLDTLSEEDRQFIRDEEQRRLTEARAAALAKRSAEWSEDWDDVVAEASSLGLPILLLMTGSDWCGYCIELEKEVFDDREFKRFADRRLVLMKADFPHGSQSRSVQEQNANLKNQFPFGGYPTVFLLDPSLEPLATFSGYGGDSAGDYITKIEAKLP